MGTGHIGASSPIQRLWEARTSTIEGSINESKSWLDRSLADRSRNKYSQGWENFKVFCRELGYEHFLTGVDRGKMG